MMNLRYLLFDEDEVVRVIQLASLREALEMKNRIKREHPDRVVRIEIRR